MSLLQGVVTESYLYSLWAQLAVEMGLLTPLVLCPAHLNLVPGVRMGCLETYTG